MRQLFVFLLIFQMLAVPIWANEGITITPEEQEIAAKKGGSVLDALKASFKGDPQIDQQNGNNYLGGKFKAKEYMELEFIGTDKGRNMDVLEVTGKEINSKVINGTIKAGEVVNQTLNPMKASSYKYLGVAALATIGRDIGKDVLKKGTVDFKKSFGLVVKREFAGAYLGGVAGVAMGSIAQGIISTIPVVGPVAGAIMPALGGIIGGTFGADIAGQTRDGRISLKKIWQKIDMTSAITQAGCATLGAIIGSALIPIPGVGTFIGSFVGNELGAIVGGLVGGKIGKYGGNFLSDMWAMMRGRRSNYMDVRNGRKTATQEYEESQGYQQDLSIKDKINNVEKAAQEGWSQIKEMVDNLNKKKNELIQDGKFNTEEYQNVENELMEKKSELQKMETEGK